MHSHRVKHHSLLVDVDDDDDMRGSLRGVSLPIAHDDDDDKGVSSRS